MLHVPSMEGLGRCSLIDHEHALVLGNRLLLSHAQTSEKRGRDQLSVPTGAPCSYAGGKFCSRAGLAGYHSVLTAGAAATLVGKAEALTTNASLAALCLHCDC